MTSPGKSAWDYGLPQAAVETVGDAIRECVGSGNHDGQAFTLAVTGSRVVITNMAAAIVHDLITSGAMTPAVPDFPPPDREAKP